MWRWNFWMQHILLLSVYLYCRSIETDGAGSGPTGLGGKFKGLRSLRSPRKTRAHFVLAPPPAAVATSHAHGSVPTLFSKLTVSEASDCDCHDKCLSDRNCYGKVVLSVDARAAFYHKEVPGLFDDEGRLFSAPNVAVHHQGTSKQGSLSKSFFSGVNQDKKATFSTHVPAVVSQEPITAPFRSDSGKRPSVPSKPSSVTRSSRIPVAASRSRSSSTTSNTSSSDSKTYARSSRGSLCSTSSSTSSRIPISSSRSRSSFVKSSGPSTNSSRPTPNTPSWSQKSIGTVSLQRSFTSFSRPGSKHVHHPLSSTDVSLTYAVSKLSERPPSATSRILSKPLVPYWARGMVQSLTSVATKAANPRAFKRSSSTYGETSAPPPTAVRQRSQPELSCEKVAVKGTPGDKKLCKSLQGASFQERGGLYHQGAQFSRAHTERSHRYEYVEYSTRSFGAGSAPPFITSVEGTGAPILDERTVLLQQSIEHRYQELFYNARPELQSVAEVLAQLVVNISHSAGDIAMERAISHMLHNRRGLIIKPLFFTYSSQPKYMPVEVEPERLLGLGGASLVYQMSNISEDAHELAVKVHGCWVHPAFDDAYLAALRGSTERQIMAINTYLQRVPRSSFATYRFLVPYTSGEFSGFPPVLFRRASNSSKVILNLVTLTPLMSGSFDVVLSTRTLSVLTKRAVSFAFVELVARLHLHKLVHGDLKPSNFFVSMDGAVYLGDFDTVGWQNSERPCGSVATINFLDPQEAQCHIQTPERLLPLTQTRDAWALGLSLFRVWCRALPFDVLNEKTNLSLNVFVSRLLALVPEKPISGRTTPRLALHHCPGGTIQDQLVLEIIQRFLELDPRRRWTPLAGYKKLLSS